MKTSEDARKELSAKFPNMDFTEFEFNKRDGYSTFVCPNHGTQRNSFRLIMRSANGCAACSGTGKNAGITTPVFINRMYDKYGSNGMAAIDVSQIEYTGAFELVQIHCEYHGNAGPVRANTLLTKLGQTPCKYCNVAMRSACQMDTIGGFLSKIPEKFKGLDSFDGVRYLGDKEVVQVTCLVDTSHGKYPRRFNDYKNGVRCPKCSQGQSSEAERELLEFCKSLPVNFVVTQPSFRNKYKPDILIPDRDLVIEYHGLYWHREESRGRKDMVNRLEYFQSLDMRLVQILENEWLGKKDIVKRKLLSLVGGDERIYARDTDVKSIGFTEANTFLSSHHLQGVLPGSSYAYALYEGPKLVSVLTVGTPRAKSDQDSGFLELHRYASSKTVVGGFTKLFEEFVKQVKPRKVLTYSDRRWGEGLVYGRAGFTHLSNTVPGYFWSKGQEKFSRWAFQKHKLKDLPEFKDVYREELTEEQICTSKNYFKVYDCGNARWEKHFS